MTQKDDWLNVRVPKDLKHDFCNKCQIAKLDKSEVIRSLMAQYVEGVKEVKVIRDSPEIGFALSTDKKDEFLNQLFKDCRDGKITEEMIKEKFKEREFDPGAPANREFVLELAKANHVKVIWSKKKKTKAA